MAQLKDHVLAMHQHFFFSPILIYLYIFIIYASLLGTVHKLLCFSVKQKAG